jgi:squalene/oxidosqualene cyclase-like protein
MFLLPMAVAAHYIAGREIPAPRRAAMRAYLERTRRDDGGVGLHSEGAGCLFATSLCYVALRLLGAGPHDPGMGAMRRWIQEKGTPLGCASWGKFVLCLLGLYSWDGIHPILPELWLLPRSLPVHPGRFWCHCRQVYLPMAWLYGRRATASLDDTLRQLRAELYGQPYDEIDFRAHRDTLAACDALVPTTSLLRLANAGMDLYERARPAPLRRRALDVLLDHIEHEDRATSFIRLGPVNAALNTIVAHVNAPGGPDERRSFEALEGYFFDDSDGGVLMNGYNSTALWDTAFATQTILATSIADEFQAAIERAHGFIRDNQVLDDVPEHERYFRHASRGGWPFSDRAHGWPITDCTAEGLLCALMLERRVGRPVPELLMRDAVALILSFQNDDGGWASYERQRGGAWLERLNPSQMFADIMVDYSYVECTSACIQALAAARRRFPAYRGSEVSKAIQRGEAFLRSRQRPDGSWEGAWGVCFTYATWFGVWGLVAAGAGPADRALRRACDFLVAHQSPDGGWGEGGESCLAGEWVPHRQSQAVNTAWALLALARAGQGGTEPARQGAHFLLDRQAADGSWPRESLKGVFNRTTLIDYDNYRLYFPVWALSELPAC